jgi:dihydrofolate reductase
MLSFSVIAAIDNKNGIGINNDIPWHLSEDLKHFKKVTSTTTSASTKNIVIMGRKTWDSLPEKYKPLPNRINFVLSRQKSLQLPAKTHLFSNLNEALEKYSDLKTKQQADQCFIIGGAQIYKTSIKHPSCNKLFITHIQHNFKCNCFFPEFTQDFKQTKKSKLFEEKDLKFYFSEYDK